MKNKTTKTVQIATNELKKCKQDQEFKIDVVTYTKDKPIPPTPPNGDVVRKPRKPPIWFQSFEKRINVRFEKIERVLQDHTEIFKRNNLH